MLLILIIGLTIIGLLLYKIGKQSIRYREAKERAFISILEKKGYENITLERQHKGMYTIEADYYSKTTKKWLRFTGRIENGKFVYEDTINYPDNDNNTNTDKNNTDHG